MMLNVFRESPGSAVPSPHREVVRYAWLDWCLEENQQTEKPIQEFKSVAVDG